jgi:hypothetical protein
MSGRNEIMITQRGRHVAKIEEKKFHLSCFLKADGEGCTA